ncbi:hypothetical protein [Volucribacter amazonae]|uniref:HTH cro/C1-type domain-containing protein n=1 Tax=Volucribacter amazonae TaxID=256731 RepID=A0A9X4PE56_9PAST|nr:hypothetical protein [Volucribacter amazonae]MDG6896004.1 hypothetical protein [Volucribacter amazonae]
MDEKKNFSIKLKDLLQKRGYEPTAATLEREFNLRHYGKPIGLHAMARWLRGEVIPTNERLKTLADWLDVDLRELVSDERVQRINLSEQRQDSEDTFWHTQASYDDQRLFKIFLNLPREQRKTVREVIIAMHKAYRTNKY